MFDNYYCFYCSCETDINECESSPCQNGGTCQDLTGTYACVCNESFIGYNCENARVITCLDLPCQDNSTCRDDCKYDYYCVYLKWSELCTYINNLIHLIYDNNSFSD